MNKSLPAGEYAYGDVALLLLDKTDTLLNEAMAFAAKSEAVSPLARGGVCTLSNGVTIAAYKMADVSYFSDGNYLSVMSKYLGVVPVSASSYIQLMGGQYSDTFVADEPFEVALKGNILSFGPVKIDVRGSLEDEVDDVSGEVVQTWSAVG